MSKLQTLWVVIENTNTQGPYFRFFTSPPLVAYDYIVVGDIVLKPALEGVQPPYMVSYGDVNNMVQH